MASRWLLLVISYFQIGRKLPSFLSVWVVISGCDFLTSILSEEELGILKHFHLAKETGLAEHWSKHEVNMVSAMPST